MDLPSYFKIWMTSLEIFPIVVISFRASFILGHIDIGGGAANWTNEKRVHITLRFTPTDKMAFPFSSSSKTLFLFIICHSHSWTWTSPALWQNERDMGSHYPILSASFTAIDHYPKGPFGQTDCVLRAELRKKGFFVSAEIEKLCWYISQNWTSLPCRSPQNNVQRIFSSLLLFGTKTPFTSHITYGYPIGNECILSLGALLISCKQILCVKIMLCLTKICTKIAEGHFKADSLFSAYPGKKVHIKTTRKSWLIGINIFICSCFCLILNNFKSLDPRLRTTDTVWLKVGTLVDDLTRHFSLSFLQIVG